VAEGVAEDEDVCEECCLQSFKRMMPSKSVAEGADEGEDEDEDVREECRLQSFKQMMPSKSVAEGAGEDEDVREGCQLQSFKQMTLPSQRVGVDDAGPLGRTRCCTRKYGSAWPPAATSKPSSSGV
jgi:hypothetical protein